MPEPVPPPIEWVNWKPWRQSHDSAKDEEEEKKRREEGKG